MKYAVAFVMLGISLAACDRQAPDTMPKSISAHYQLAVDTEGNSWTLDTTTGETKRCWQGAPGLALPQCYIAVQH